jgi:internalin A
MTDEWVRAQLEKLLKKLTELDLSHRQLTELPPEIAELSDLSGLFLAGNSLISPPPEIASMC